MVGRYSTTLDTLLKSQGKVDKELKPISKKDVNNALDKYMQSEEDKLNERAENVTKEDIAKLYKEASKLKKQYDSMKVQVDKETLKYEKKIKDLTDTKDRLMKENSSLTSEVQKLKNVREDYEVQKKEHKKENDKHDAEVENYKEEIEGYKEKLSILQEKEQNDAATIELMKNKNAELSKQINGLKNTIALETPEDTEEVVSVKKQMESAVQYLSLYGKTEEEYLSERYEQAKTEGVKAELYSLKKQLYLIYDTLQKALDIDVDSEESRGKEQQESAVTFRHTN